MQNKGKRIQHNMAMFKLNKTKHVDKNKEKFQISPLHIISPTMCSPLLKGKQVG